MNFAATLLTVIPQADAAGSKGRRDFPPCVGSLLSTREREVLTMISEGLSNKHIARILAISPETVKTHVKRIFLKLAVSTRAAAVSRAGSLGRV